MFTRFVPVMLAFCCIAYPALGETALQINSEPGDGIGEGQQQIWTSDELDFSVQSSQGRRVVSFSANNFFRPDPKVINWWGGDFAAPQGLELIPGAYEDATRYPFQSANVPGLDFGGNGRGCNTLTGRFDVLEAEYDQTTNEVLKFAADFEQHCEGNAAALFGAIRFNSDIPMPSLLTAKIDLLNTLNGESCVEATAPDGALISLAGSSAAADVDFTWSSSTGATGSGPAFSFPLGVDAAAVVTLAVEDKQTGHKLSRALQVCVSDTTPPAVAILAPLDGQTITGEGSKLRVQISDLVDHKISQYKLRVGDSAAVPLNKDGSSNIQLFKSAGRGPITTVITVDAMDASGNVGTSTVTIFKAN